jgi:small neutral amino acid transporter SnatA (MarC family)
VEQIGSWLIPVLVVLTLAGITLLFATYIGRWIDAQGNDVVTRPRERKNKNQPPR